MSEPLEVHRSAPRPAEAPAFYFDFAFPDAYLAAERILALMPVATEWLPVLGAQFGAADGTAPERVEARAAERGLQRFVWPEPFPFDSELAMRAATYARGIGRVVAFSLAAFRQCYAGGRSLESVDNVVIAASACEMHPAAVIKGCDLRSTRSSLAAVTSLAAERGVHTLPAVYVPATAGVPERVYHGDDELEQAAQALSARAA